MTRPLSLGARLGTGPGQARLTSWELNSSSKAAQAANNSTPGKPCSLPGPSPQGLYPLCSLQPKPGDQTFVTCQSQPAAFYSDSCWLHLHPPPPPARPLKSTKLQGDSIGALRCCQPDGRSVPGLLQETRVGSKRGMLDPGLCPCAEGLGTYLLTTLGH